MRFQLLRGPEPHPAVFRPPAVVSGRRDENLVKKYPLELEESRLYHPKAMARDLSRYWSRLSYPLLLLSGSAAQWRSQNGPITLFTDGVGAEALRELGMLGLWDEVNEDVLESIDTKEISPLQHGAAAKFVAYQSMKGPFAVLDTDLIVWQPLVEKLKGLDICFTHWESTTASDFYPGPHDLCSSPNYHFEGGLDWSLRAANVAFLYLGHQGFKEQYVEEGLRFLQGRHKLTPDERDCRLLFAEQRLLSMLGERAKMSMGTLIEATWRNGRLPIFFGFSNISRASRRSR